MAETGYATGTLSPIIFFERQDGFVILPAYEAGDPSLARKVFEERYKNHPTEKWMWRETDGNLRSVDDLQKRLVAQEERETKQILAIHGTMRDRARSEVASNLRSRLCSSKTSEYEREFIRYYLELRDDAKRDKYRQALEHRNSYLWAREQDSSTTVMDRMPAQDGEFWRNEQQQKG